jgi:diguanylate cyclase (GGDEF)-like protein/PAS domain S-box-containing protein
VVKPGHAGADNPPVAEIQRPGGPGSTTGDRRRRLHVAHWSVAGALALLLGTILFSTEPLLTDWAYLLVSVGAAAAGWAGVRRRGGQPWGVAWNVACGLTLTAVGDVLWQLADWSSDVAPDVSVADACYLAAYVGLAGALLVLTEQGRLTRRARLHAALDGATALVIALLVVWQSSLESTLTDDSIDLPTKLVWAAYPVLDAMLIGLVARWVFLQRRFSPTALLLVTGAAGWLAGDLAWLLLAAPDQIDAWLNVGWLVGAVLLAAVTWQRPAAPQDHPTATVIGPWRLWIAFLPLLVPTGFDLMGWLKGTDINPLPGLLATLALVMLIIVRTLRLLQDSELARAEVRTQARRAEALAVNSSDAVAVVDASGTLTADSRSLATVLGLGELPTRDLPDLLGGLGVHQDTVRGALERALRQPGTVFELELPGRRPTGEPVWLGGRAVSLLADPDVRGIVVSLHDITSRKLVEQELAHQAFHDGLTGLANRALFLDRAEQSLRRAGRTGGAPTVLCLDLDGFKDVNDSLGHLAGDTLLRAVATRLEGVVRSADTVARLGGDEFAVLVDESSGGLAAASALAERVLYVLGEPIDVAGQRVRISASVGIVAADAEATPLSLLRDADIAMYRAKASGRAQWVVFAPDMRRTALERIALERELGGALAAGQLRLVYQPVVDLQTELVVGFEALLRWDHPELGVVGPDRFIPIAEESGLIVPIGHWVLDEATRMAAQWQQAHPRQPPLSMAVNVSARQLTSDTLIGQVQQALTASGIPPSSLVLEVTETALVTDPAAVADQLAELRRLGIRLALDDFGTGYSSLSYLQQFAVDILKIDRSFVGTLTTPGGDAAILHGLLEIGRRLQLEVVAEGVELEVQRDLLRTERCALAQGFLFAEPLDVTAAELMLIAQPPAGVPASRADGAGEAAETAGD